MLGVAFATTTACRRSGFADGAAVIVLAKEMAVHDALGETDQGVQAPIDRHLHLQGAPNVEDGSGEGQG